MAHQNLQKISKDQILDYAQRIGERFMPEKVILFGSYASGNADKNSDVDLFVIMNFSGRAPQQAYEIRKAIPKSFPLDLIVRRPQEVEQRLEMGDLFIRDILSKGKILYEKDHSRMA
jgi:predicted nucleotidyltransferase